MIYKVITILLLICFGLATTGLAQEATTEIGEGEEAPYSGLLLPEIRHIELLETELHAEALERSLLRATEENNQLHQLTQECLDIEGEDEWYDDFWVGALVGIGATVLVWISVIETTD